MSNYNETKYENGSRNSRKILVVGNNGLFSNDLINHSVHLAGRLSYDLVALSVDEPCEGTAFETRSGASAASVSVSVASAVLRLSPARPMHAPKRK